MTTRLEGSFARIQTATLNGRASRRHAFRRTERMSVMAESTAARILIDALVDDWG